MMVAVGDGDEGFDGCRSDGSEMGEGDDGIGADEWMC
jgi:hypothetical protein